MSLAYAPTTALCCAAAIPAGRDDKGLPFGIQVVGRRGSDLAVLQAAAAIEQAFAVAAETSRPVPDISKLAARGKPA